MYFGKCNYTKRGIEKKLDYFYWSRTPYEVLRSNKERMNKVLYYFLLSLTGIFYFLSYIAYFVYYMFIVIICASLLATVAIVIAAYIFVYPKYNEYKAYAEDKILSSEIDDFRINNTSYIYDNKGLELAKVYENSDLTYLKYSEIPQDVVNAFVAIEDRTYWTNKGFDPKGLIRVGLDYIKTRGKEAHGASTITQQLVRGTYLTREVSLDRKGKELFLAYEMYKKYTKEQILEFYINDACFANGIYGIEGASEAYFGKKIGTCSLSQIAYLCAIPNSPTYYNPYKYPERALDRRDKILHDMRECGYIDDDQYMQAMSETIHIEDAKDEFNDYLASYAIKCAVEYFMKLDGFEFMYYFDTPDTYRDYLEKYKEAYEVARHTFYTGGYKVYTTLDKDIYSMMQENLDKTLEFNQDMDAETNIYTLQGAVTCIDNKTGKVVALVGGRTQDNKTKKGVYSYNRAYQGYRQPGSSFKPIAVYTPALEIGYTPDTKVYNISVDKAKDNPYKVQLLTGDVMTLRSAVEQSKNGVAWQVFDKVGYKYGLDHVTAMHFAKINPLDYIPAASLGGLTTGVTTVEMAGAYRTLENHGRFNQPTCLTSIKDGYGEELYEDEPASVVYKAKAADDMVDILKGVVTKGTASSMGWYKQTKIEAFGKTGTTNNSKDGWFCGATPYYTLTVWVGFDMPKELSNLYGATYPAQIWKSCMLSLIDGKDEAEFKRDETDASYKEKKKELSIVREAPEVEEYDLNIVSASISNMSLAQDAAQLNLYYNIAMGEVNKIVDPNIKASALGNANAMYATVLNKLNTNNQ